MDKNFWTTKNIIFTILAVVLLVLVTKITGILLLFFAAYVIACALNPFVKKLETKMNRILAASLVISASIISIIGVVLPIFILSFKEIKILILFFPEKLSYVLKNFQSFRLFGQNLPNMVDFNSISPDLVRNVFSQSWNLTLGAVQFIVIIIALGMIIYYILVDKSYLKSKYLEFFPPNLKEKGQFILESISSRVGGYVRAQILSMAAVGIMAALGLSILGVDYPVLLGLITGVLDIIPILGPAVALTIILLVAYPFGLVKFLLIVFVFLAVQQASNYIMRPILFGKFMSLHPLMVYFALFVAQQFLGFWGVILSPAIAATICVLIDELYIEPINKVAEAANE
jgi:predicted PurR-regulated permease PerM